MATPDGNDKIVKFHGAAWLRQRLILSCLSGRSLFISEIRANERQPGLKDYEASLIQLLERIMNGVRVEINDTGTKMFFRPGILVGGEVSHNCPNSRALGYYLEALVAVAPFCKEPLVVTLTGVTNHPNNLDISVDLFRTVTLPNLHFFGVEEGLAFAVTKRGAPPNGGGEVSFRCPVVRELKPISLIEEGKIRRVRGIAFATRVSPQLVSRLSRVCKGLLLKYIQDVYIYNDRYVGKDAGNSPGYGIVLVAESQNGCLISSERMASAQMTPEDIATDCANELLQNILAGGCIDSFNQSLMLLFMALGSEDVSEIRMGRLSEYTIEFLRHLKQFFGVEFDIKSDTGHTILLSCRGLGYTNVAKASF